MTERIYEVAAQDRFLEALQEVSRYENPYDFDNEGRMNQDIDLPDEEGVYLFKSMAPADDLAYTKEDGSVVENRTESSYLYGGKASSGLKSRLTNKVKADLKEKRVWQEDVGIILHEYPYIEPCQRFDTILEVYALPTTDFSSAEAERIILGAHYVKFGDVPLANRTGIPRFAREAELQEFLLSVADSVFV